MKHPFDARSSFSSLPARTPITPPHTAQAVKNIAADATQLATVNAELAATGAAIAPTHGGSLPSNNPYAAKMSRLLQHSGGGMADALMFELTSKTLIIPGAAWDDHRFGDSTVSLFGDDQRKGCLGTTTLAGADLAALQGAVIDMPTNGASAMDQILLQSDLPNAYLAIALGLQGKIEPSGFNWTCLVIDTVLSYVAEVAQALKDKLDVPRPQAVPAPAGGWPSGKPITPLIPVPRYQSFPGGHAAVLAALQVVLAGVRDGAAFVPGITGATAAQAAQFNPLPTVIAFNRERAGLHTALDTAAGTQMGAALGLALLRAVGLPDFDLWSTICEAAMRDWP